MTVKLLGDRFLITEGTEGFEGTEDCLDLVLFCAFLFFSVTSVILFLSTVLELVLVPVLTDFAFVVLAIFSAIVLFLATTDLH